MQLLYHEMGQLVKNERTQSAYASFFCYFTGWRKATIYKLLQKIFGVNIDITLRKHYNNKKGVKFKITRGG